LIVLFNSLLYLLYYYNRIYSLLPRVEKLRGVVGKVEMHGPFALLLLAEYKILGDHAVLHVGALHTEVAREGSGKSPKKQMSRGGKGSWGRLRDCRGQKEQRWW
jgi:hypothetical protein